MRFVTPRTWSFTPQEARFIETLMNASGMVDRDTVLCAIAAGERLPHHKIVDVILCRVRGKLADLGVALEIFRFHGRGLLIDSQTKARFLPNEIGRAA